MISPTRLGSLVVLRPTWLDSEVINGDTCDVDPGILENRLTTMLDKSMLVGQAAKGLTCGIVRMLVIVGWPVLLIWTSRICWVVIFSP